jgi:hypothetical protein
MASILRLVIYLGLAVGPFLAAFSMIALLTQPTDRQIVAEPLSSAALPWTSVPTPVDRASQDFELVAQPARISIAVEKINDLDDSASFSVGEQIYLLDGAVGLKRGQLCRNTGGALIGCGNRAVTGTMALVRNKALDCRFMSLQPHLFIVNCKIQGRNLTEELLRRGFVIATRPVLE